MRDVTGREERRGEEIDKHVSHDARTPTPIRPERKYEPGSLPSKNY